MSCLTLLRLGLLKFFYKKWRCNDWCVLQNKLVIRWTHNTSKIHYIVFTDEVSGSFFDELKLDSFYHESPRVYFSILITKNSIERANYVKIQNVT